MKQFFRQFLLALLVPISMAIVYFLFDIASQLPSTINKAKANEEKIMRYDSTFTAKNKVQNTFIYENRNRLAISTKQDSLILAELKDIKTHLNEFGMKQNILLKNDKKSLQQWNEIKSLIPKYLTYEKE